MLHEFLAANRLELIERCRIKTGQRGAPTETRAELSHGVPAFLDQVIRTLQIEQGPKPADSRAEAEMGTTAARHGRELSSRKFTVEQVVHDYGDLCQSITDLASEHSTPVTIDEFRTLNRCLDNGIAEAVTAFVAHRGETLRTNVAVAADAAEDMRRHLGFLGLELKSYLQIATSAFTAIKVGQVGATGATGAMLDRSLAGMRTLIDRSLADFGDQ